MQDFLHEFLKGDPIPKGKLAYMGASLCNLFHQAILLEFEKAEKLGLTKRELARRIGKKPEQITRWLSYPSNLTLETAGEILLGVGVQVESLGFETLTTGARTRFPNHQETPHSDATQTPVKSAEQVGSKVVPIRSQPAPLPPPPGQPEYSVPMINVGGL
jgi:transcriptional regulator with XRE-family HTH domain